MTSPPSLSARLAALCLAPVGRHARERATLHILDWYGCAAAGAATATGAALWTGLMLPGRPGEAADPWHALLFDAAVGNILEMDDIHRAALCHPGPVIVPAALFVGRRLRAPGTAVLDAIVRGYEAAIRLGRAAGAGHYRHWHPTATCGVIGAAVASASLLELSGPATAHAIGHAATRAAGLWQVRLEPNMAKAWHNAHAAQTGVQAASLAQAGATAPAAILEGEKGFFAAMCPGADPHAVLAPTGDWQLHDTSIKPWPACRHTHPAIDAALVLRERLPGRQDPPARVDVATYADALGFCDNPMPRNPAEARFSLQHAVAVTLLHGEPGFPAFAPEMLQEPTVAAWRARIGPSLDDAAQQAYPAHFGAALTLRWGDGRVLEARLADARGDPERPLAPQAVAAKARANLAAGGWPPARTDTLVAHCLGLPMTSTPISLPHIPLPTEVLLS
ncbi:MmgE/PrpD family protein [Verticiella sediminum]|uniref:MmgE/PrpD family protein n=1 Tax=Verticiella sediminum TaxID=1247510 RepID=A0A556AWH8_9BURK|nr:MmgE/PrpD family protein [Verticiella sediminum]TSH97303.1 MmgE/PrpD family protein [Verticiella sediminum]